MLTKAIYAIVLTGALYVSGDAAFQSLSCCDTGSSCCVVPLECCSGATQKATSDCCSTGSDCCAPLEDCCVAVKATTASTVRSQKND